MYYIVESDKSFEQALTDLEAAVERNGFRVLHVHDLAGTLRSRGIDFPEECRIAEVCNAGHAAEILKGDMKLNMALPCRISVFTENGVTKIGLIRPTAILSALSDDPALEGVAEQVEGKTIRMVDESR